MKALIANILALLLLAVSTVSVRAADIAVVMSSDADAYQEALEGFIEVARHRIVGVQNLKNNAAGGRDELIKMRATTKPDLVYAIGTPALQLVAREITDIPVVHAMVFNPATVSPAPGKNSTGITMNPSAEQVMSLIKELNPKYRRIGLIFDPSKSAHLVTQARQIAQKEALQLLTKEIHSPGDITAALNSVRQETDLLFLLPDETIITDEILQRIFLFSFENKIPVLGFSERHTQTGALLSLSHGSVKDMGRQAAQLANTLIAEKKLSLPAHVAPRETKLTVNLKTARKLAVDVPDRIVNRADNAVKAPVYKEGDWWVFRTKILSDSQPPRVREHRVVYKNGKFESDDPGFLSGGDTANRPLFLPFASVYTSDPQRKWLDFPLLPGKTWRFRFPRINFGDNRSHVGYGNALAEVTSQVTQIVQTAAGQFHAIEIQRQDSPLASEGGLGIPYTLTYFYSPQTKSIIKSTAKITERYAVGYQYELELIAYGNDGDRKVASAPVQREARAPTAVPEPTTFGNVVNAPVYKEGDWWVFRIRTIHQSGKIEVEEHRVDFRNGRFETLHPIFLTGGDLPSTPSFLPFVSVYIPDPVRKFFDFPLLPGKTWSFRYPRVQYPSARPATALATAEVKGRALSPIQTPAGKFDAVEITRTDQLTIPAHLTYFYSPQTKSVVKLSGEIAVGDPRSSGRRFELELIAFGNEGDGKVVNAPVDSGGRTQSVGPETTPYANVVNAPVYNEGDWWVFRIKILSHSQSTLIQDHRVIYKNGKFNSEDPSFLAGGDEPSRPSIYPFPSFFFADPQRKWLDFPLLPGKKWSYRFLRTQFSRGPSAMQTFGYGTAVAEVMGQFPQMVQTAAGKFSAIEIQRQDSPIKDSSVSRPTSLTYYYSPQTKSVIKSIAHASYRFPVGYQFELELIAYGNEGDGK